MGDFTNRRVLITGAASGIGAACAQRMQAGGAAALLLVDRAPIDPGALFGAPAASVTAGVVTGDVADEALWTDVEAALAGAPFGPLDVAVVNAGVSFAAPITTMDFADWRRVLAVNLDGAFLTLRSALRHMRDGGAVVVISSASAIRAEPGVGAYSASKAGLIQLARVAAKEAAPRRIRVNVIAPGGVETPMWSSMDFFRDLVAQHGSERAAFDAIATGGTPLGRYATAGEIAAQAAFLCSDAAATITGAVLTADGGYTL